MAHGRPIEIFLTNHIGRTGTNLSGRQQPIPDQPNNRHFVDAKTACGFMQDQLMPLGPFALTIDCDLMCTTEVTDAQMGPAMAFGRAYRAD